MYTRVFESILDSSINVQRVPPSARWLWVTMLLIADQNRTGIVDMPVERLAARAGLSIDQTLEGLSLLSAPDIESTSPEEGGRRIVPIREDSTRGWKLVNWEKYKAIANEEQQREATRRRVADFRERKRSTVTDSNVSDVTCNTSEAEAASTTPSTSTSKTATAEKSTRASARGAESIIEAFELDDSHRIWAAQSCPSVPVDDEFTAWKDRLRANGYRTNQGPVKDAAASWRTSMKNAEKWGSYTNAPQRGGNGRGHAVMLPDLSIGGGNIGRVTSDDVCEVRSLLKDRAWTSHPAAKKVSEQRAREWLSLIQSDYAHDLSQAPSLISYAEGVPR